MEKEKIKKPTKKESEKIAISKRKIVFVSISAVILIILGVVFSQLLPKKDILKIEEAKIKAETFINENLMLPGTKAVINEITPEFGLYKMSVDVGSEEIIESYISKDGKLFFPQAINIQEYEETYSAEDTSGSVTTEVSNKQDKLDIELFIMSHCPYGTQMEKGLLPVVELLKNYVNFSLKFNTYAMHDKAELDEQLNQYCIQKEENDKLISYLNCFNRTEDSSACLTENKIDKNKISSCVQATDKEYKITESYNDASTWLGGTYPIFPVFQADNEKYSVEGSPTLIINGEMVSANRDSQSLLNLACSGFVSPPTECQTELSSVAPSYGFGE
ncbi:MAG: hypothetical protein WC928_01085 [Patescibacteria group bacterium]|jgi:hypothetical protein